MTQWIHFPSGIPTNLNKANSTLNYSGPSRRHTHKHSHKLISSPFVPAGSMLGVNGTRAWHFRAGCTSFVPVIFSVWANVSSDKASWPLRRTGPRTAGGKFACVSEFICMTKPARAVLLVKRGLHQSWLNRIRGPLWHHPCVSRSLRVVVARVDLREIVSSWWLSVAWCLLVVVSFQHCLYLLLLPSRSPCISHSCQNRVL